VERRIKGQKDGKQRLKLKEVLRYYNIEEIETKFERIEKYLEMVKEKRVWAGLTSKQAQEDIEKVILVSMTVFGIVRCRKMQVVEIGSGGGVLGIVAALACPKWEMTLTERNARKTAFLAEVVGSLGIDNVEIYHGDAEELIGKRDYDLCLSRASGRLKEAAPLALGLLKQGGNYIAIKGTDIQDEVTEAGKVIEANRGRLQEVAIPDYGMGARVDGIQLVVIKKA
jgi:16S rRNA (guanine527-N7)-methyltransferase